MITEKLRYQTCVSGLGATCARTRKLKHWLVELAALNGVGLKLRLLGHLVNAVIKCGLLNSLLLLGNHRQGTCRAHLSAVVAAHAIQRGNSDRELQPIGTLALGINHAHGLRCRCHFVSIECKRANGSVRAHKRAGTTLYALRLVPMRNHNSCTALLIGRCASDPRAVCIVLKGGNRELVALHEVNRNGDVLDLLDDFRTTLELRGLLVFCGTSPLCRHLYLFERRGASIDSLVVCGNDVLALLHVRLCGCILHVLNSISRRQDIS